MGGRSGILAIAVLAVGFVTGLGSPPARSATPPPNLTVQVAGFGKVAGTGIACGEGGVSCFAAYGAAQTVTLASTPGSGWTFSHWEDDAAGCGTTPTCPVSVTTAQTATAVFTTTGVVQTHTFDVTPSADGAVTNNSTNYAIDCDPGSATPPTGPQVCSLTVLQGSTITVQEAPASGSLFGGWGGACTGTKTSCSVYIVGDEGVSADFVSSTATTLSVSISGNGSVSGGGISCSAGSSCDAQEPPNSKVALTASAANGYAFTGWSGDCSGMQTTCTVQMDTNRAVSATFAPLVPLNVTASGNGSVSGGGISSCSATGGTCSAGEAPSSTVTLTASPGSGGSVFWSGCTSASGNTCTVTMGTTATSVFATFSGGTPPPVATDSLTVSVMGDGYVTAAAGSSTIYCTAAGGASCTTNVPAGTSLTLTAVPASGLSGNFTTWSGACAAFATTSCTLTMNGAKSVGATFAGGSTTYVLSGQVSGAGTITGAGLDCTASGGTGCSAAQAAGATVILTASPSFGATFAGWTGACSGTTTTCSVTMSLAKSVTAEFAATTFGTQSLSIEVTGAGRVTASGGTCSSTSGKTKLCTQSYTTGKAVTLTAKAAPGNAFAGWKGACTAKTACTVTMSSSTQVQATFARLVLAGTKKPVVAKTATGYRVTLSFAVQEPGTLKLVGKLGGSTVVSKTSRALKSSHRLVVAVAKPGRYVFTLTLVASGKHSIRWTVKV